MTTPQQPNEAARLTQQLVDAGYNRAQIARMLGRNASLVTQFFTRNKGASLVPALRQLTAAVQGGVRDIEELRAIAAVQIRPRTTRDGRLARTRARDTVATPGGSVTAQAGRQAIASGAAHLADAIHQTAQQGGRIALTVRMRSRDFNLPSGSLDDSPGLRRGVVTRADRTEERSYGSKTAGGMDAAEWSARVAAAHGDVTDAVLTWLVETGRAREGAEIVFLQVRGWVPRRR